MTGAAPMLTAVAEEAPAAISPAPAKRWSLRVVVAIAIAALAIGAGAVLAIDQVSRPLSIAQAQRRRSPRRIGKTQTAPSSRRQEEIDAV